MSHESKTMNIKYHYLFDNNTKKTFDLVIDKKTLTLVTNEKDSYPPWTELGVHQCPVCPLDTKEHKHCPVAKNLVEVIEFFSKLQSIERVKINIETPERNYSKETDLQTASGSLIGIYMVTSNCPIMNKLSPMVRFHLPFPSLEETQYRSISMYLLSQYFAKKHNLTPDWKMEKLPEILNNIKKVNISFCKRLKEVKIEDSSLNAIIKLDNSAQYVNFSLMEQMLEEIEELFTAYLSD